MVTHKMLVDALCNDDCDDCYSDLPCEECCEQMISEYEESIRADGVEEGKKQATLSKLDVDEQYEVSKQIEAEIRAKAINEYTSKLLGKCMSSEKDCQRCPFVGDWCQIAKIAEQLKKKGEE